MQNIAPHTKLCGAKTRNGGTCHNAAMSNGKCRMHGGKSLAGIANGNYKTGRYSKYLPQRLSDRYHEARTDGELLSIREEIALLDSRLADLLSRVDSGEAGKLWTDARNAFKHLSAAFESKRADQIFSAMSDLDDALGKGTADYAAWSEIQSLIDQRRRLSESEQKRLATMQQIITSEDAMLLVGALLDSVRRNVTDRKILSAVQNDFIVLTNKKRVEVSNEQE